MLDLIVHNALVVTDGERFRGWVAVGGDTIAEVGRGECPVLHEAGEVVDASGALLLPGAIDTHVHFRDPGLTRKADMSTESAAAVMGGVTSFIDMPNTVPPTVTVGAWEGKMRRASLVSVANYGFFIGATNDNFSELLHADYTRVAGVKLFLGSSTGNMLVDNDSAISRIFRDIPALVAVHAESEEIVRANRERAVARFGNDVPLDLHPVIRSREACVEATRHAVELARLSGARLHVCHVSTADELALFSDKPLSQKRITAETCPQYLLFDSGDYASLGSRIKCNPAVKLASDREALLKALNDGRIDTIATDHAPHLLEEKRGDALAAVSGMPMVQFSLPAMLTLASDGLLTIEKVVELMCHNPAEIYRIERRGHIRKGAFADMALVGSDDCLVTDADVASRCGWTPLAGRRLRHRVLSTWVNGQKVWDGSIVNHRVKGAPLRFGK